MKSTLLSEVYNPEIFREQGHALIDLLAGHLEESLRQNKKVINWNLPEDEKDFWEGFLASGSETDFFKEVLVHTTHVHNPRYIGHQVCAPAPIAALSGLVSAMLNNGMAVYEMGMAPTAIERIITDLIAAKIGFDKTARGILTSGGTLANLTAILAARKAKVMKDVWKEGSSDRLAIMVSEEAHYCVDRAARIMGLGSDGIIKVPVTDGFVMDSSKLEAYYQQATEKGLNVFALVGSAPSTATGIYDDLEDLAAFCKRHGLWLHVDGAHGGAAVFSDKYKKTVKGIELADSVVIDGHKMMLMSTITTALIFRDGSHSHTIFSQEADYLLQQSDKEDWFNLAKRTFECTKTMMSLQWFLLFKTYGEKVFDENVTTLYDLGQSFGKMIVADPDLELATTPGSNIVCFRFVHPGLSLEETNDLNRRIRQELLEEGKFYIVQTRIRGKQYLRCTIMNPFTTIQHLDELLSLVRIKARQILNA
ncbi:pyridoxal phosphate-dependent decarboxylase family protein [Muriicola soli]|uniref:Aminotransferase class I/II-fold pyridoxal phosphate-dependent enzyme n=1 Tax=Muriicola soli TaxID=2507538 RepID=A0A411E9W3_9FLAO|nr:aminotransferase class I/II-fold pyridoxal phosphate-dependent enzyme [Muriicola soli]QBA64469.1 aminotransferase class I/II-fold pyridoxal phosphate-dependent enzyme [Muriicola soli]